MLVNYSYTARVINCAPRSLRDPRGVSRFSSNTSIFPSDESFFFLSFGIIPSVIFLWSIPVDAQSKAWVCVPSLVGIAGSNPAGSMDVRCVVCCELEVSAKGRNLIRRSRSECCVSEYDLETSTMRRAIEPLKKVPKINRSF